MAWHRVMSQAVPSEEANGVHRTQGRAVGSLACLPFCEARLFHRLGAIL